MQRVMVKATILASVASCSSIFANILQMILFSISPFVMFPTYCDTVINSFCVLLMFNFRDDLYSKACCLCIRCYELHVHRKMKHGKEALEMEMANQLRGRPSFESKSSSKKSQEVKLGASTTPSSGDVGVNFDSSVVVDVLAKEEESVEKV